MLETPLYGRFQGENRRLLFGPPAAYYGLTNATVGTGIAMILIGFLSGLGLSVPFNTQWWLLIGLCVLFAGIAAHMSMQSIVFDLHERTYLRRQGPGMFPKSSRGAISNIDALVCLAEPNSRLLAGGVTYHLVLYWRGNVEPLMVVQQDTRTLPGGQPINAAAGQILAKGAQYASALGVPYHDNTHFPSSCPVTVFR